MEDLIGKTIDKYKIIGELGRGGMAVVYRAVDTLLDRNVAIKLILTDEEARDKGTLNKRFTREAKILAKLSHANIVKVIDFGKYKGSSYLVMEYIPGGTLKNKLGRRWHYADAAAMLIPIAKALGYAHNQKVIHRDVKPANILLNESGQPLLSDFGIIKLIDSEETQGLTGTGKIIGTPNYMSPEQIRGKELDGRSDLYSLGVLFFEMITNQLPYVANTPIEVSLKHLNDPTPKARQYVRDLPVEVEQFILKAMAKKPEDRFQTGAEMAFAFEKLIKKQAGASTQGTIITNQFNKPVEKKKKTLPVLLIGAAALLLGVGIFFIVRRVMNPAVPTAMAEVQTATGVSMTSIVPTLEPTRTPVPAEPSPVPTEQVYLIRIDNIDKIIQANRLEGISVIELDWMKNGDWIINVGSTGVSFIDPQTLVVSEKIAITESLPIAMAVSPANDRLFVLLSTKVIIIDIPTANITGEISITGGAYSIASSTDGSMLALGMMDNKVQLVNAADGRVIQNLKSNYGGWSVAFSPDSSLVAEGTSLGILAWETDAGIWLQLEDSPNYPIRSIAFSDNGQLLAGGSQDEIFIWNVASGKLLTRITGSIGMINSIDFSPDGTILVSGSDNSLIKLWKVSTGEEIGSLSGHTSPVYSTVFSPNGDFIVSGANEGTIRTWTVP